MKKFVLGLCAISLFGFAGCADFWDFFLGEEGGISYTGRSYSIVTATETKLSTYNSSESIYEVAPTTKYITISNVPSGKSVYIAKVNTGNSTVALADTRVVRDSSTGYRAVVETEFKSLGEATIPESKYKHFQAPEISLKDVQNAARAGTTTGIQKKTQIARDVGTTKPIYVDTNVDMNSYDTRQATLRAVGTYCNVWVVDGYFTTGNASGAKVDSTIAKSFAEKFDSFYPVVRNIFGEESDNIVYSNSSSDSLKEASAAYPMTSYSDTGTIVNIVLYDIGNDYGKKEQCGVLGYFYSKDYFSKIIDSSSVLHYSNQGKYFYIDSAYSVSDFDTIISTLAHEFQHMVNFGVKNVEKGLSTEVDTAYNEMLSMLCEDMMSEFLGLSDEKNIKSERLPSFNTTYFISGIREYRNDSKAALSYSTSYGFGSWLCRQYGGAALVKEIMSNNYGGNESLVNAVNSLNGKNYTFTDLFKQFLLACTNGGSASGYTHNQNAKQTVTYKSGSTTYTYPMTKINLWDSAYSYPTKENQFLVTNQQTAAYDSSAKTYKGPFLFGNGYGSELRPNYGITLHKLGTTSDTGSLSLTFSDTGADCVMMYVIIQ